MGTLLDSLVWFAVFLAIFFPLELAFPARRPRLWRREFGTDLLFFFGQFLLWTAPVVAALTAVHAWSGRWGLGAMQEVVASQPYWLQFVEVIFLSDLAIYWGHRWSHHNTFLWRFHRVHHTAEHVDWLAAYREHPFDNLYTRLIENLPMILLGFPLETLAGFAMFRGLWALYIHSNTTLTPGALRYLIGAPRLHHWHHEVGMSGRCNFANLSPVMDLMFGTYHDPGNMPDRYGIPQDVSHGYFVQMLDPVLPRPLRRRLQGWARARRGSAGSEQRWAAAQRREDSEHVGVVARQHADPADGRDSGLVAAADRA